MKHPFTDTLLVYKAEPEKSLARLAKDEKTQFTDVNEYFSDERNEANGFYGKPFIKGIC